MVEFKTWSSSSVYSGKRNCDFRASLLSPKCNYMFSNRFVPRAISPVLYFSAQSSQVRPVGFAAFSSSAGSSQSSSPKIPPSSPNQFPPPPPINPPETEIPDPATLREQWKYATRMYSKWYGHAWGTAILAGASFYALGWWIKGGNPLLEKEDGNKYIILVFVQRRRRVCM
ncbi:hypothetical protein R1sor_023452 [Riccia sorocarpa]|uniref:Uncharacterized protein n=1 Tax=Riccia sorocarpa TaxID=122646 RepID=A0ABD3GP85_9MARC